MSSFLGGNVSYLQLGLAFAFVGAVISFFGFFGVSERGLTARAKRLSDDDLGWVGELCAQRYDLRWGALLIAAGFGLQLIGAFAQSGNLDARLALTLVIAAVAYLVMRAPTISHDICAAKYELSAVSFPNQDAAVSRLPKAA